MIKMLQMARELNSDIFGDLHYIARSNIIIAKHWTTKVDDEDLASGVKRAQAAMTEYLQLVKIIFDGESGKKGEHNAILT